jgi:hypothetical protein
MWPFSTIKTLKLRNKNLEDLLSQALNKDFSIRSLSTDQNTLNATFAGGAIHLVADALSQQFKTSGADNFITMDFSHINDGDPFQVILQRIKGESITSQLTRLKDELNTYQSTFGELPKT